MGAGMSRLHDVNYGNIPNQIRNVKKLDRIANINDFSLERLNGLLDAMGAGGRLTESFVSEYHQAVQLLVNCLKRLTDPDINAFGRGRGAGWGQRIAAAVASSLGVRARECRDQFSRLVCAPIGRMMSELDMGIKMPGGRLNAVVDKMGEVNHVRYAILHSLP